MTIEELRALLAKDIVTVSFTKKNGDKRVMQCTTISDYLPYTSKYSVESDSVITVWDLENAAWRSFRHDSILSVETDYFNYAV